MVERSLDKKTGDLNDGNLLYQQTGKENNGKILKNISGFEGYESYLPKGVRLFRDEDYNKVDIWMKDLTNFYDGHTDDNKLIDQLVGTHKVDENGYFTKSKIMLILEDNGEPLGMACLNIKRGGSVKIGPVVVEPKARGKGIGRLLFSTIDQVSKDFNIRKLYATTSHLNERINTIFQRYGYKIEAILPDQYKEGSNEYIWGKIVNDNLKESIQKIECSVNDGTKLSGEIYVQDHLDEQEISYLKEKLYIYKGWHNDLGDDFLDMMLKGFERGKINLNYQDKGKKILIAKDAFGNCVGILTFSPKRGGAVKIYPISGATEAQKKLIEKSLEIAKNNHYHKLYTFTHEFDETQILCLKEIGFSDRGKLISPYKDGHNLIPFDLFVK